MKLPIPAAALDQHVIALGKTGSGKSSKLRVLVEWLLEQSVPVCILDAKGDWWGLKSSADGKHSGYPIVIFGGKHADVPINPHAGASLAELIMTGNRPCLIDLRGLMPGDRTRFFIDFASKTFEITQGKRVLVIPEIHNFAPKGRVLSVEAGVMLHWANRLASEGRGLGLTLLADSQRPQKVHNDLLTSCETLIACRVIHKADRDAIKDWIDGCADPELGAAVLRELAGMKRPESWVWSPEIEFGPERMTWPLFKTYDSFKPQDAHVGKLKGWAEVDLQEVRARLQVVVAEAEANDPRALHKRIAELEEQLRAEPPAPATVPDEDAIQQARAEGFMNGYTIAKREQWGEIRTQLADRLQHLRGEVDGQIEDLQKEIRTERDTGEGFQVPRPPVESTPEHSYPAASAPFSPKVQRTTSRPPAPAGSSGDMGAAERKFLTVLAQRQGKPTTRNQVAIFSGYSAKSRHVDNTLGMLRSAGYASGNGADIRITAAGVKALGAYDPLPTGRALRDYWLQNAGGVAEAAMLRVIFGAYPRTLTRDAVATASNYSPTSRHVDNTLGRLRSLDLIEGPGSAIRASVDMFT